MEVELPLKIIRVETDYKALFEASQRELIQVVEHNSCAVQEIERREKEIQRLRSKVKHLRKRMTILQASPCGVCHPLIWLFEPMDGVLPEPAHNVQLGTALAIQPAADEFYTGL